MNRTQYRLLQRTALSLVPLVFLLLAPGSLTAQQGLGFGYSFGYQSVGGDYGDALNGGIEADFAMGYTKGRLRYGAGANWASLAMEEPFQDESWSNVSFHFGLAFFPRAEGAVRPFIEGRMVGRRLRPENGFLGGVPAEGEENTSPVRVFGVSGTAIAGVEIGMTRRSWARLAAYWGRIDTADAELGDIGMGTLNSGTISGFRVGIFWTP